MVPLTHDSLFISRLIKKSILGNANITQIWFSWRSNKAIGLKPVSYSQFTTVHVVVCKFFPINFKIKVCFITNATISQIHWDGISFIYVTKRKAPRIDLCGMPIISIDPEVQMEIHFVVLEC